MEDMKDWELHLALSNPHDPIHYQLDAAMREAEPQDKDKTEKPGKDKAKKPGKDKAKKRSD